MDGIRCTALLPAAFVPDHRPHPLQFLAVKLIDMLSCTQSEQIMIPVADDIHSSCVVVGGAEELHVEKSLGFATLRGRS